MYIITVIDKCYYMSFGKGHNYEDEIICMQR